MQTFLYINSSLSHLATIGTTLAQLRSLGLSHILNYYYCETTTDIGEITAWLDACHVAGLKSYVNLKSLTKAPSNWDGTNDWTSGANNSAAVATIVNAVKGHPACYGWYTDDESTGANYPAASRIVVYDFIKALSDKPIFEVHYLYDAAAYTDDAHDAYGIDSYPWINSPGSSLATGLSALDTTLNNLYPNWTAKDKANLFYVIQAYGLAANSTPPIGAITGSYAQESPEWFTGGVGFYTWLGAGDQTGATYVYPWEVQYIRDEILEVCTDYLGAASAKVLEVTSAGLVSGTCTKGTYVSVGAYRATVSTDGLSWSATVPPGDYTVTCSNGFTTETIATVGVALVISGQKLNTKPISDGQVLRVFDNGSTKYLPLVDVTASDASAIRFYDGVKTWAVQKWKRKNSGGSGFGFGGGGFGF